MGDGEFMRGGKLSFKGFYSEDAACRGQNPEIWFDRNAFALARAICSRCRCKAECLTYAIENHEQHGIWGGMSAWERGREARRWRNGRV